MTYDIKKIKITKGLNFFSQWPNLSAGLSEKFRKGLAAVQHSGRVSRCQDITEQRCSVGDRLFPCRPFSPFLRRVFRVPYIICYLSSLFLLVVIPCPFLRLVPCTFLTCQILEQCPYGSYGKEPHLLCAFLRGSYVVISLLAVRLRTCNSLYIPFCPKCFLCRTLFLVSLHGCMCALCSLDPNLPSRDLQILFSGRLASRIFSYRIPNRKGTSIVADPECLSRIPDPGFYLCRIPDPTTATKEGEKFLPKNVTKLSKIWVWNPGSGKNLPRILDPGGFRVQKGTGSRIRIRNTALDPGPDLQQRI